MYRKAPHDMRTTYEVLADSFQYAHLHVEK